MTKEYDGRKDEKQESVKERKILTFYNEFSKVRNTRASGRLGNTAVEVLLRPLDVLQLEGH